MIAVLIDIIKNSVFIQLDLQTLQQMQVHKHDRM